jgi:transglutaminase-like putative cysteine protease
MDFSAWFEAYIGGHWHTSDPRHNCRRIGRVLLGRGRDAADVPITMVFGKSSLENFSVITEEIEPRDAANPPDFGENRASTGAYSKTAKNRTLPIEVLTTEWQPQLAGPTRNYQ